MKTKGKIIIVAIVFLVLISIYGYTKAKKLKAIFEQIEIKPISFRNLKASFTDIRLNVDVEMYNPTSDNFDVAGYVATLKRLNLNRF